MKNAAPVYTKNGYILRLARAEDAHNYYYQNFHPLDGETAYFTGSKSSFTYQETVEFFLQSLDAEDRFDFLILAPDNTIVGEGVINEIDWDVRSGNFRIAIFQPKHRGHGIGQWVTETLRDFAFEVLHLHRLSLSVFSFNPRAQHIYQKVGFHTEGILRESILDGNRYADEILMSILESEWANHKKGAEL